MTIENGNVKNLSFYGEGLAPEFQVILESLASLTIGKALLGLDRLSMRECEAFLRDRNSQVAVEPFSPGQEEVFQQLVQWLRHWSNSGALKSYRFPSERVPFRDLNLVEKVKEL